MKDLALCPSFALLQLSTVLAAGKYNGRNDPAARKTA